MKKLFSVFWALLMLAALVLGAGATESAAPPVVDNAGVLTAEQVEDLTQKAFALREQYGMDVAILVVTDLGGKSPQDYADDYYDESGYGVGHNDSGVLLLIATESRDWWISTCGDAIYALTDYGIESVFSSFAGYLSDDDYYGAFETYLDCLPGYFQAFQNGAPIDGVSGGYTGPGTYAPGDADEIVYYENDSFGIFEILVCLAIGCAVSGIVVLIMSLSMNTKVPQNSARNYMNQGSYRLQGHSDLFLYSNVTKVRRQESSSGGGSSVHRSSGGRSHGGGGGKF